MPDQRRINKLLIASTYHNGWWQIIDNLDATDLCTEFDVFRIRTQARYLALALRLTLTQMPSKMWNQCIIDCIELVQKVDGVAPTKHPETFESGTINFDRTTNVSRTRM